MDNYYSIQHIILPELAAPHTMGHFVSMVAQAGRETYALVVLRLSTWHVQIQHDLKIQLTGLQHFDTCDVNTIMKGYKAV